MSVYESWCRLECGECEHFQVDADRREDTTCKRLDHKKYKLAVPYFKSYDCGQFHCNICSEFKPKASAKWLHDNWESIDAYMSEYESVEHKAFLDGYTVLCLDGNTAIRYYVKRSDYFYNQFVNTDGSLKWVKRCYYKKSRKSPIGYELIWEYNHDI